MTNKQETLFELIGQAREMLLDRSREEADLIYAVSKMDSEERGAIILAYDLLYKGDDDK